jgi:hypothetical protein
MTRHFDEFSKSLAESCSRRESLRAFGALFAGAVLSRLPLSSAWGASSDTCKTFCKCRNKTQQNQCLTACKACSGDTQRLCGSCGSYVCCAAGYTCCSGSCVDRLEDPNNCGACGNVCEPGPNEYADCLDGECVYTCVEGAVRCNGTCTFLDSDPNNCGACGNVCGGTTPYCDGGTCSADNGCGGADLLFDALNCGACGHQCQPLEHCSWGVCEGSGGGDSGY